MFCCSPFVMVLLGLLGDVHKGNFTWNLKAFDEFQSLLNCPSRIRKVIIKSLKISKM